MGSKHSVVSNYNVNMFIIIDSHGVVSNYNVIMFIDSHGVVGYIRYIYDHTVSIH